MIAFLAIKSAGIGIGTFIGVCIGLFARRRRGAEQWLLGGSIVLTALAAAVIALVMAMLVNYVIGGFA
ncbi:MAG: hypothetical protein ABJR46_19165 [Tateyamaria sp.]|uniref:hypothetical protein n=1 Tax=Tateyamaria sp. TaxID=1929288 RepID=UPI003272CBE4